MATLGGATALWMSDEVGSLEPGKQADIVVFDTDNFDLRPLHNPVANIVYGSTGHSVDTVLIGGEVVLRHGSSPPSTSRTARQVEQINRRRPRRDRHLPPAQVADHLTTRRGPGRPSGGPGRDPQSELTAERMMLS